ncbi:attF component of attEFGH ABC transport system [Vibrio ishigakensis]|uniref:AttF component of attEFGH ABC transport system n=1 Tax=Vibrio ishigakensis TaxID=1481914 RepID=A0A0B8P239_9VIBR|nr:attF component of attEFGH ABC transport system [Vibrio ishigakensis]
MSVFFLTLCLTVFNLRTAPTPYLKPSIFSFAVQFNQCIPFDIHRARTENNVDVQILGMDSLATAEIFLGGNVLNNPMLKMMQEPYPVLVNQVFMKFMGWKEGQMITLYDGEQLGPLVVDSQGLVNGSNLVVDMALSRKLRRGTGFSVIGCTDMPEEKLVAIKKMLPEGMTLRKNSRAELVSLTKAFHLNLTALGMLSFLIGLFIFYQPCPSPLFSASQW